MTATANRSPGTGRQPSNLAIMSTLGRFEGRQMVRHPLFWLGVLVSIALAFSELMEEAPVLNRVSTTFAWTMAPIGAAVALLAGWAVLRARGRTDAHPPAVMPSSTTTRVAGALVGLLWPAAATFGVQLLLVGWTYLQDPVTSIVWSELLVGPVFVVLAGGFSAAATRWLPHPSTPLFALLVLAGVHVVIPFGAGNWGEDIGPAALAPIAWPENFIPYEVAFRPSGLHLAYLLAVVLIVVAAATLGRAVAGWVILGVGMLAAGVLGSAQVGPIDEGQRTHAMSRLVGDEADLTCETHSIIYCAMPGYEPWIDDWAGAVQPMLDSVPSEKITELEVRQYPVHNTFLFDGINTNNVFWWWVGPAYEDYVERDVVAVASTLADQTLSDLVLGVSRELIGCEPDCEGASRQVVIRWLISHDQQARENLELQLGEEFGLPEVSECMVAELWEDSNADELIRSNWETLAAVDTSYEKAGEILDVEVPEYDENGRVQEGCL